MKRRAFLLGAGGLVLAGCGAGTGGQTPVPLRFAIYWSSRTLVTDPSRAVLASSAPLSALISLRRGAPEDDGPISFPVVDRQAGNRDDYEQAYVTPSPVRPGPNTLSIRFYTLPGGQGTLVRTLDFDFTLRADGTGTGLSKEDPTLFGQSRVASVEIVGSNTIPWGTSRRYSWIARDAAGAVLDIPPEAGSFSGVQRAGDPLPFPIYAASVSTDGGVGVFALGPQVIFATVEGVASPQMTVTVVPPGPITPVVERGQIVEIGPMHGSPLRVTADLEDGTRIPVADDAREVRLVSGGEFLDLLPDGRYTAKAPGVAVVRARVAGVDGPPEIVLVGRGFAEPPLAVMMVDVIPGTGAQPAPGDRVTVRYRGYLRDGTVFATSGEGTAPLDLGTAVRGLAGGLASMRVGGRRLLQVPYWNGYGEAGDGNNVPPRADLVYDVELLGVG